MIKINTLFKNTNLTKLSNGSNIFIAMKGEFNKDNTITKFVLDFEGMSGCSPIVFKEVVRQMQQKLDGQFQVELINATPLIKGAFKIAING